MKVIAFPDSNLYKSAVLEYHDDERMDAIITEVMKFLTIELNENTSVPITPYMLSTIGLAEDVHTTFYDWMRYIADPDTGELGDPTPSVKISIVEDNGRTQTFFKVLPKSITKGYVEFHIAGSYIQ